MMGERHYEGICEVHYGPDGGALHTEQYPEAEGLLTIEEMVMGAAEVDCPDDSTLHAFEQELTLAAGDPHGFGTARWRRQQIDEYRRKSGRRYPPVYRVCICVEAEVLSEEETAAHWRAVQERYAAQHGKR